MRQGTPRDAQADPQLSAQALPLPLPQCLGIQCSVFSLNTQFTTQIAEPAVCDGLETGITEFKHGELG